MLVGMCAAFVLYVPAGPAMVIAAVIGFAISVLLSPSHGVVFRHFQRLHLNRHIQSEDVLKALYRASGGVVQPAGVELENVSTGAAIPRRRTRDLMMRLVGDGMVSQSGGGFALTEDGRKHAERIVRTHRLWETYLNREGKLSDPELHAEAERLEHAHELAEELDQKLGRPETDPHGSEIPREKA